MIFQKKKASIFFSPGFGAETRDYVWLLKFWADKGYLVIGVDYPNDGFTDPQNHKENAMQLSSLIDAHKHKYKNQKIILTGHSKGAKISFFSATLNSKVDAVIAFDPVNAGGPPCFISDKCHNFPVASNPKNKQKGLLENFKNKA